jgi:hypothetical protein
MWDMYLNSFKLFCKGKLFRDPRAVLRMWSIGFAVTVGAVVVLAKLGTALWLAVMAPALLAGVMQPLLFKNLKYN